MWCVTCVCVLLSAFLRAGFPRRECQWEPDDNGFRGYVFATEDNRTEDNRTEDNRTEDNRTVALTIKCTSIPIVGGGPTILFSCCCLRVSRTWTPVCDC